MISGENNRSQFKRTIKIDRIITPPPNKDEIEMKTEKEIELTDFGDVIQTETRTYHQHFGEIISNIDQITSRCEYVDCNTYLTQNRMRVCNNVECEKIVCISHSRYDSYDDAVYCIGCWRTVRWRIFFRALGTVGSILVSPFIEKR